MSDAKKHVRLFTCLLTRVWSQLGHEMYLKKWRLKVKRNKSKISDFLFPIFFCLLYLIWVMAKTWSGRNETGRTTLSKVQLLQGRGREWGMEKEQREQHYMTCQLTTEDDDSHLPNLTSVFCTHIHLSSIKRRIKCFGWQKRTVRKWEMSTRQGTKGMFSMD